MKVHLRQILLQHKQFTYFILFNYLLLLSNFMFLRKSPPYAKRYHSYLITIPKGINTVAKDSMARNIFTFDLQKRYLCDV